MSPKYVNIYLINNITMKVYFDLLDEALVVFDSRLYSYLQEENGDPRAVTSWTMRRVEDEEITAAYQNRVIDWNGNSYRYIRAKH